MIIEPFCAYLVHFGAQWDSRISRSQRSRWSNISALYDIQSLWVASKSCYVFCVPHTCSVDCGILLKGQYLSDPRDAGTSTRTSTSKKQTKNEWFNIIYYPLWFVKWLWLTDRRGPTVGGCLVTMMGWWAPNGPQTVQTCREFRCQAKLNPLFRIYQLPSVLPPFFYLITKVIFS